MQTALMLGAGHSPLRRRLKAPTSAPDVETKWASLDIDPSCHPDILLDLNAIEQGGKIPVLDSYFDEIHAYEVLEHYGHLGDYEGFFTGFREFWRILKPGGVLMGTSPTWNGRWAWGDPGHVRIIQAEQFFYLEEKNYANIGVTAMTDYGAYVRPHWWILRHSDTAEEHFVFCLEKSA